MKDEDKKDFLLKLNSKTNDLIRVFFGHAKELSSHKCAKRIPINIAILSSFLTGVFIYMHDDDEIFDAELFKEMLEMLNEVCLSRFIQTCEIMFNNKNNEMVN